MHVAQQGMGHILNCQLELVRARIVSQALYQLYVTQGLCSETN